MIDIDQIARLLGIPTWEKFSAHFDYGDTYHYAYKYAYDEAIKDGSSEDEAVGTAEAKGQEAEWEAEDEAFKNYYDALMHVAEKIFGEHHLQLVPVTGPAPRSMKLDFDDDGTGLSGLPRWVRQPRRSR
jgi:hypothetical protein